MKNIYLIMKKELDTYFFSLMAYLILSAFLIGGSWLFMHGFFIINQATMRGFFGILPWLFLIFIPAITMRSWAEERKLGTIEFLLTQPVTEVQLVLGKFLASFLFVCVALFLTFPIVLTVFSLGNPDPGPIIGGYVGALFMSAAFIAIGEFISSLCENQIIALIMQIMVLFIFIIIGENFVMFTIPPKLQWLAIVFKHISLSSHFANMSRGIIDSRDVLYYVIVTLSFLYLNVKSIQFRRLQ